MKNNFDLEVKKILKEAENEMFELNHPYVGSEHMLLAILKINRSIRELLKNYDLTYDNFRNELISVVGTSRKKSELALYTPLLKRILASAVEEANENGDGVVKPEHLLISMLEEGEGIGIRILLNMDINLEGIYNDLSKKISPDKKSKNSVLLEIGKLLNSKNEEHIFKREKELDSIIEILLRKNKNNPLLLGEAGVGKTAIVEELARRIEEGRVPENLENYKIVELDTGSLISGTRYRGEFEDRLNKIIKEILEDGKIILFIDEIHTLVNCGGAEGAIDAANILKPYLARGSLKVIGATTRREYKMSIYKDKALERRFQIVNIEEPSIKDTEYILKNIRPNYERHHNVTISDDNIKDIIKYSEKYIHNRYNPDKAIDILDSVCAHVQLSRQDKKTDLSHLNDMKEEFLKNKKYRDVLETEIKIRDLKENSSKLIITEDDIKRVVVYRANIPLLDTFNEDIKKLPSILKSHIFGQDKAIDSLCEAIKEKYLMDNTKPLSILLKGTPGTGKTLLAKEIANNLFGNNQFLRLDMSELSSDMGLNKLLGTTQGYVGYDDECLLGKIKDYPYSLLLLDEIDKASPKIKNIFSEILDTGEIRNGKGEMIHFENTTIIMTTSDIKDSAIGFEHKNRKTSTQDELLDKVEKVITLDKIDETSAKKYIKRESLNLKLTKSEIAEIIKAADIDSTGLRGVQKELNRHKIHKLLTKV